MSASASVVLILVLYSYTHENVCSAGTASTMRTRLPGTESHFLLELSSIFPFVFPSLASVVLAVGVMRALAIACA